MLGEASLQLGHAALQSCDLLVKQEMLSLDLEQQAVHEGANGGRCDCPVER